MMRILSWVLVSWICAFSLSGCCKCAQPAGATADAKTAGGEAAAPKEDELVCRKERVVGSHQLREVCHYKRQKSRQPITDPADALRRNSANQQAAE